MTIKSIETRSSFSLTLKSQPKYSHCLSCFSGYIFTSSDLAHFDRPILNYHSGRIPENRGRSPLFWDIIEGQSHSYGTLHTITPQIDMGRILQVVSTPVETSDNPSTLASKLLSKALDQGLFLYWLNQPLDVIYSVPSVLSQGHYKTSFSPTQSFPSNSHTSSELLLLWRCFQIWGSITIDSCCFTNLSITQQEGSVEIRCSDGIVLYGITRLDQ